MSTACVTLFFLFISLLIYLFSKMLAGSWTRKQKYWENFKLKVIISSVLCACDLISLTWYFTNNLQAVNYYMYSIIPTIYIQFSFQTNNCLIAHAERNLYFDKSRWRCIIRSFLFPLCFSCFSWWIFNFDISFWNWRL